MKKIDLFEPVIGANGLTQELTPEQKTINTLIENMEEMQKVLEDADARIATDKARVKTVSKSGLAGIGLSVTGRRYSISELRNEVVQYWNQAPADMFIDWLEDNQ